PTQTKLAYPVRVLFDIRDVMDSLLAQPRARIAHVSLRIKEIPDVSINIDGFGFGFHCRCYLVNAGSTAPSRAQSYPLPSTSRPALFRPLQTIPPPPIP